MIPTEIHDVFQAIEEWWPVLRWLITRAVAAYARRTPKAKTASPSKNSPRTETALSRTLHTAHSVLGEVIDNMTDN